MKQGTLPDARWLALAVLTVARAAMGFQFQAPAAVGPLLLEELPVGASEIGFLIGLYMLPGVMLALPAGLFGARFADTRIVAIGLALMAGGGLFMGFAESYPALVAGRAISGVGAVLLNVFMAKMVTDWFSGREIVLAMAIFMNAFPGGIGLALLSLGWLGEGAGVQAAFYATAGTAIAALLLLLLCYRPHANDAAQAAGTGGPLRLSQGETLLVCLAGAIWGLYNGAFTIALGFAPLFLVAEGMGVSEAGFIIGLTTWLVVASVQVGGMLVQRWGQANAILLAGITIPGICLLLLPTFAPVPLLVLFGLLLGLPVGIIVSLPAAVLRPEVRAAGMGVFFTGLYLGHSLLPALAGRLQDLTASRATAFHLAGLLLLSTLPLYAAFRTRQTRPQTKPHSTPARRSPSRKSSS